jgi:RNA polymerase sigma factor
MNSQEQQLLDALLRIKNGDRRAREKLVAEYRPFVLKTAIGLCKRGLEWGRDDELSIGLIAFNHAIDAFDPERRVPFLPYCRVVISNQIRDHFRKEARHRHNISLDAEPQEGMPATAADYQAAWEEYQNRTIEDERREELELFAELLAEYDTSFDDLVEVSPKHRDSRAVLLKAARDLSARRELMNHLTSKKQLPLKELELVSGVRRKTLERGRKFIITCALILSRSEEFVYLRSFINFGI